MDEQQLDRLVAEAEIRNVVARLAHLADDGDLAEYLDLFTEDATWESATDRRAGREDLLAGARQRRADGIQGPGSDTRHVNTTLWVRIDGPDTATAESYFLFLADASTAPRVRLTGRYEDTFRRTPDGWKLASRRIRHDVNAPER